MSASPASVLICDDNAAMRVLLGAIVDIAPGLRVVGEATDGDVAVTEATRLQPDLILLDLAMPNRGGLDALPELREVAPEARIVVLSGFAAAAVAAQAIELGATTYLEKGSDPDAIVTALLAAVGAPGLAPTPA